MASLFTYRNPLDDFASYSVHYIMLATRNTKDAQAFVDTGKNAETLAAIEKVHQLGEVIPYGPSSTAYLIMDTRRFSQFTIERMKYDVLINGVLAGRPPTNFVTDVELTIIDSVGISFINFLQWLMNEKMQTNFNGIVYMLRVIFVGHHPDGTTETVQNITIPMIMGNIEFNLEAARGVYTANFQPYTNFDAVAYRRWLNVSNASTYFTGKGGSKLGGLIDSIEKRLNEQSQSYFDEVSALFERAERLQNPQNKYGRLVKYQITIPNDWTDFIFAGGATASSTETVFDKGVKTGVQKPGQPTDAHLAVEAGEQLTTVLDRAFAQVNEIAKLAGGQKVQGEGGSITFYKHLVSLSSDDAQVTVHIDVIPFKVPNVYLEEKTTTIAKDQDDLYQMVDGARVPKNYFELDYIYTGKNSQVLNFDMKVQDISILLRSSIGLGADAVAGVTGLGQKGVEPNQKVTKTSELVMMRAYDPIILPKNSADELKNFSNHSSLLAQERGPEFKKNRQDYTRNLSMFYAMSPIQVALTIKGNPLIMDKFNIGDFVPQAATVQPQAEAGGASSSKAQYRRELEAKILKDNTRDGVAVSDLKQEGAYFVVNSPLGNGSYTTQPVFFKINIHGPNVNYITSETVNGEEFSKAVLYQNYYAVMTVSNLIEGGTFTQSLDLWSHNVFGYGKINPASFKAPQSI